MTAPASEMPPTPMIDKMAEVVETSEAIGQFVDWLGTPEPDGAGLVIAEWEHRIECHHARGRGFPGSYRCVNGTLRYDIDDEPVLDDANEPERCESCDGRGWRPRIDPVLIPAAIGSINRLLARYFDIDLDVVEREAVLAHVRAAQAERAEES